MNVNNRDRRDQQRTVRAWKVIPCAVTLAFCAAAIVPGAASAYQEAPSLNALVKAGKLPAVDQRLPAAPRVLTPIEEVGQYGGVWRTGMRGGGDKSWLLRIVGYEPLVAWDRAWTGNVIPNVAESFSVNPAGDEFTFKLRRGMKWSDGKPFGVDDIEFFVNDVMHNRELMRNVPPWFTLENKPPNFSRVDSQTFKLKFQASYGMFLSQLARVQGPHWVMMPKHYCSQFMPKYNKNAEANAKAQGLGSWQELYIKYCALDVEAQERWTNPARPTIEAWRIVQPYVGGATVVTFERNPYYWKVDPKGNQLPYIDSLRLDIGSDVETLVLKAASGEIDFQDRHISRVSNKAMFVENQKRGDYRLIDIPNADFNTVPIAFNLTHKDPVKRAIFSNKNFRIALSHAIDRQAIIDTVFIGQGEPWGGGPRKESPFYNERLAKQYLTYDVKKANELLDQAGYKMNAQGQRLGPDGKPIRFTFPVVGVLGDFVKPLEMVREYWKVIGIDMQLQQVDRVAFYDMKNKNEHDVGTWLATAGMADGLFDPRWYFPFSDESLFAVPWGNWYSGIGTVQEEPPAAAKEQMQLYEKAKREVDTAKRAVLMQQIMEIAADQFYIIGISTAPNLYAVTKNNFRNVAPHFSSWMYPSPGPMDPAQFFIRAK
jgi:peptide/nickel transport system substrate-binding protein